MNKKLLILLIVFSVGNIFAQKIISIETGRISLSVKYPPPDTVGPILKLFSPVPNPIENLPVYVNTPEIVFEGKCIERTKDIVQIAINDSTLGNFSKKGFQIKYPLKEGKHDYHFKLTDMKGNERDTLVTISYEPNGDFSPPEIYILDSVETRGLKIVKIGEKSVTPYQREEYINGILIDTSGIYGLWINGEKVSFDSNYAFSYHCNPSEKIYKIKAMDNRGNIATKNVEIVPEPEKIYVKVKRQEQRIQGLPFEVSDKNYYALIIGIQDYEDINIPSLDHPIEDATKLAQTLKDYYMFAPENIVLLKNPTRREIIKKLKELREKLTDKDNLLVFYAGHGYWDQDLQQGFWLPRDASLEDDSQWLSNGRIRDYIRGIKTKHTLLIADACFSGGIFKSREVKLEAPLSVVEMYKAVSRRAITSGTLKEVPDKSVFVQYLIKRLKENTNRFLTSEKLYYDIKEAVINNSPIAQTPEYGVIYQAGDEGGGSFIFIRKD